MATLSPAKRAVLFRPQWTPKRLGSALTLWVSTRDSQITFTNTGMTLTGVAAQTDTTLTGVGTAFINEVKVFDLITATGISGEVVSIQSDTSLTLSSTATSGAGLTITCTPQTGFSDRISQINDLSGLGNHLTSTSAFNRPSLRPNGINGKKAMVFDDMSDILSVAAVLFPVSAGTVIVISYAETINANQATPDLNASVWNVTGGNAGLCLKTGATAIAINYVGAVAKTAASTVVAATPNVILWQHDNGFVRSSVNGGAITSTAAGDTDAFSAFRLGNGAGRNDIQRIGEVIVVNRGLSPQEQGRAVRYLGRRWGVAVAA